MRIIISLTILLFTTSFAQAESISDVFGISIGSPFNMRHCAFSSTKVVCAYKNYTLRELDGEVFMPVYIPSQLLPKYVNPSSVRIKTRNGIITDIRYSILNGEGDAARGREVFADLTSKYGAKKTYERVSSSPDSSKIKGERTTAFKLRWDLPEVSVTLDASEPRTKSDILATATISLK